MPFSLKKIFNDMRDNWHAKRAFNAAFDNALKATKLSDGIALDELLPQITTSKFFSKQRSDELLQAAVKADNVKVFEQLLQGASPHIWLIDDNLYGVEAGGTYSCKYILNEAIERGSKNIALYLVQHQDIDVTARGYVEVWITSRRCERVAFDPPIVQAEEAGMEDVMRAIAARIAAKPAPKKGPGL